MIAGLGALIALLVGALVLATLAVLIDRLNFPQRPFQPRSISFRSGKEPRRDRTGAHLVDDDGEDGEVAAP